MSEERRIQLVAEVDTTRTRAGFAEIGQQAGQMASAVERQGARAERAVSDIGGGAESAARNVEAAQRSLIQSIQRTTAQMQAGSRTSAQYFEVLARQRGVNPNVLTPYLNQLRAVEQEQVRTGASAGQVANAMRMVPAQLNDIAVQLAGGQSPVMVMMQQGSQLRDMFGSIPAAARGVGQSLLGLVNPYTVAAAAVTGLAFAYHQGSKEADAYIGSVIMSGNVAGTSRNQLADYAREISKTVGTQAGAAESLAALVSTGQVGATNLQKFGTVAIEVQRNLGRSVQDTVNDFAELGRSPVEASKKLNDVYHYLTAATLAQIKALDEQGRTDQAAEVAQNAYATAFAGRAAKVQENLGTLERGWRSVKDIASKAWDAMLDVGRDKTPQQELAEVNAQIARARQKFDASAFGGNAEARAQLPKLQKRKVELELTIKQDQWNAAQDAISRQLDDNLRKWNDEGDKFLSREEQRNKDLKRVRTEGLAAGVSDKEIQDRVARVYKAYADLYNAAIDSNIAALKRRDQVQDVLSQRELARVAAAKALGNISEDQAINQTADAELAAFDRKRKMLEDELTLTKRKANSVKEQSDLEGQIDVLDQQRKSRQIQRENDLLAAQERRAQASAALYTAGLVAATAETNTLVAAAEAQFEYNQEIGLSQVQVADIRAGRLASTAGLKEESAAALEALDPNSKLAAEYRKQAQALRDRGDAMIRGADKQQRYNQFKQAVDQYDQIFRQGFADMLNNGDAGWHSFTKSLVTTFKTTVADEIYKMFARPFVVQLVGSFTGMSQPIVAGEIASGAPMFSQAGAGSSRDPISAAQAASSIYGALKSGGTFEQTLANGAQSFFDKLGLSMGGGVPGTAATWLGRLGGTTAGFMGGSAINGALSGQYQTGSGFMKAEQVGTAIASYFAGPIGGAIAGAIGGLFNRAFGMGDVKVTSAGLRGTLSAGGVNGQQYTNFHQDGGWFRSDKNWSDTPSFTGDQAKQFTEGFRAIEDAAAQMARSVGLSSDALDGYTKTFDIALGSDKAANEKAITDFFTGLSDEIAKKLVPNLDQFTKSGESASAALQRLSTDFNATNTLAQMLGKSATDVFGSMGMDSAASRERLVELAGGVDALGQQASVYAQNFLTDAERLAPVTKAVDEAMASLGLSSVRTVVQFKSVVDGLVSSGAILTDAGAKQFTSLMAVAGAFAQAHSNGKSAAEVLKERESLQEQLDQLTKSHTALLVKQRDALDESNRALFDQVQAIQSIKDAAKSSLGDVDNAFSALRSVVDREKDVLKTRIDAETEAVNKLKNVSEALHSALDSMHVSGQAKEERATAQAQIKTWLAIAKAGGALPNADSMKKALGVVTQDSASQFTTYQDYLRDFYSTQNDIADLAKLSDNALSVDEQSLKALQDQVKQLDDMLAREQSVVDAIKGVDTSVLTIPQAIEALREAILTAQANPVVSATEAINKAYQSVLGRSADTAGMDFWQQQAASGMSQSAIVDAIKNSPEAKVKSLYQSLLGRGTDAAGLRYWLDSGASLDQIGAAIKGSAEYKKLHPFDVGINRVPYDMPAQLHRDEAVVPAIFNPFNPNARMNGLGGDTRRLEQLIEKLTETVELQGDELVQIRRDTKRQTDGLQIATGGWDAMRTMAAT